MDDSVLRPVCQVEAIVNHGRVCLDGEWFSARNLGKNAVYRFVRERGYLLLVPHLDAAQRADLIARWPRSDRKSGGGPVHQGMVLREVCI